MPQEWTAEVVAQMHLAKITKKRLAEESGYTPEYVSMVLNGHRGYRKCEGDYFGCARQAGFLCQRMEKSRPRRRKGARQ